MKTIDRTAMNWLHFIGLAALGLSLMTFLLYVFSILPSGTGPGPADSVEYWSLSTGEYLEATGIEAGSLWMTDSADGYRLSTAALAVLATTALPTLLALSIAWMRRRDWLYGAMALAVSAVLAAAIVS